MEVDVQENGREGQEEARVRVDEEVGVALEVLARKALQDARDLLRFAGQPARCAFEVFAFARKSTRSGQWVGMGPFVASRR